MATTTAKLIERALAAHAVHLDQVGIPNLRKHLEAL